MKIFSFYEKSTGRFNGRTFGTDEAGYADYVRQLAAHTPEGHVAIEGKFDHLSQKVNVVTGEVEDYRPNAPSNDHEFNTITKRWELNEATAVRNAARAAACTRIAELERAQQRPVRELTRDTTNAEARKRIDAIDSEIAKLREVL